MATEKVQTIAGESLGVKLRTNTFCESFVAKDIDWVSEQEVNIERKKTRKKDSKEKKWKKIKKDKKKERKKETNKQTNKQTNVVQTF